MCPGSVHLFTDLKNFKCGSLKTKEKLSFFGLTLTSNYVNWKRDMWILYFTGTLKKKNASPNKLLTTSITEASIAVIVPFITLKYIWSGEIKQKVRFS